MKFQKRLLICQLALLCSIALSSCGLGTGAIPPEVRSIVVNDRVYGEVPQDTQQKLNLSVASCSGLSKVGEIDDYYSKTTEVAYAYPDPRYPNLVVALVDEKPTIFQFANFLSPFTDMEDIRQIYGLTTADAICEISISTQQAAKPTTAVATITEKDEIAKFFDALIELPPAGVGYGNSSADSEDDPFFPAYFFDVSFSNGFSTRFTYYPKLTQELLYFDTDISFDCSDAMAAWIHAYID